MSSNPPSRCCIAGVKHEGEATGTIDKVGTQDAYIAYPPDKSKQNGIILFPDFMGYELTNMKLLADQFATNGYFTVIPDMWEGDNVPLNWKPGNDFNLGAWMGKHNPSKAEPIGEAVVKAMREDYGVKKLGGVGYCLGAKYWSEVCAVAPGEYRRERDRCWVHCASDCNDRR